MATKGDSEEFVQNGGFERVTHAAFTENGPLGFEPASYGYQAETLRITRLSMLSGNVKLCSNHFSNFRPDLGQN